MSQFTFDGSMSREVLESYLSRAVTHTGLAMDNFALSRTFDDDLRMLLQRTMTEAGFRPLSSEWWHFTLRDEPYPDTHFTFPVSRASLCRQKADFTKNREEVPV